MTEDNSGHLFVPVAAKWLESGTAAAAADGGGMMVIRMMMICSLQANNASALKI